MSNTTFSMIKDIVVGASTIIYKIYDVAARPKERLYKRHSREEINNLKDDEKRILESESELGGDEEQEDSKKAPGFFRRVGTWIANGAKKTFGYLERGWDKVSPYVNPYIDFFTSNSFCRIVGLVGACFLLINPISMPIAIAAVSLSVVGAVAGIGIEAYRLYDLREIQNEEKLLHEAKKIDTEQKNLLKDIGDINPKVREYFNELAQSTFKLDENLQNIKHKFKWKDVVHKSIINRGPENIASIIYGFASFNFVYGAINAASCALNFAQGAKMQHAFESQMAKLLNDIEVLKTDLNLAYPNGQGTDLIKMSSYFKKIDNTALSAVSEHLKKNPSADVNECINVFDRAREQAEKTIIMDPPRSFADKCKEYFHSFKDVIVKGFSDKKTTKIFAPRANKYEDDEPSKAPEKEKGKGKEKEVSKATEINKIEKIEITKPKKEELDTRGKYTRLIEEKRSHGSARGRNP